MNDLNDSGSPQVSGLGDYFDGGQEPFAAGVPVSVDTPADAPAEASLSTADGLSMTRSEERVQLSTVTQAAGRVRLRKFVVSEDITTTVTVSREVVELEREPVTENELPSLPVKNELSEGDYEVVLYAERVVVTKEVVPVERIRVARRVVTEDHEVDTSVGREQIEAETLRSP